MPDIEISSRNRSGRQCWASARQAGAIRRAEQDEAERRQHLAQQIALDGIVVGDQDRLARTVIAEDGASTGAIRVGLVTSDSSILTRKVLPAPTVLVTLMSPPITPASSRLMVRPRPVPVCGCETPERAALERREDAFEIGGLNAGAGVDHFELGDRAAIADDELTLPALRELDGVRQQVDQDLAQALFVGVDHDRQHGRPLENEIDALGGRLQAKHVDELIEEFAQANLVARQIQPAGLDFRDIQNAVDQAGQMFGAAADHAHLVARLACRLESCSSNCA